MMFELEEYSSGFHEGFLHKYSDLTRPTLDLFMSDSLQDVLNVDIRTEIANVVGGSSSELESLEHDLPSSLDHAIEAISSINNYSISPSNDPVFPSSYSSSWMSSNMGSSWSNSNDFFADVGACVDPNSVMPLISTLGFQSPQKNLNVSSREGTTPPCSPSVTEKKSHLTFSPAQMKISAGAMRNEHITSHIPKQIVTISSAVTAGTTAPATLATNSALQRRNHSLDLNKKESNKESNKITISAPSLLGIKEEPGNRLVSSNSNMMINSTPTNTIKLAPGIGGLTFANSLTYNKLKHQSSAKSPNGSPITTNGTIVFKRDRTSSPLPNAVVINSQQGMNKALVRNAIQTPTGFTPKSIASAHSPLMQTNSQGSPNIPTSSSNSPLLVPITNGTGNFNTGVVIPISTASAGTNNSGNALSSTVTAVLSPVVTSIKPMSQKVKQVQLESEYPKPAYSYSCLIAMALKNSRSGSLPVSEIYSFMCEHFPYFKNAPNGWKNSVRHNLSLNKCFEKIEKPATNGSQRKGCLWAMNPDRITKMDDEVQKWSRKDPLAIRNAMIYPEHLPALERGEMKHGSLGDSDIEDSQSETEEISDLDEQDIVENMFVEEDSEEEDEMLSNSIAVINEIDNIHLNSISEAESNDIRNFAGIQHRHTQQQQRDFDIEGSLERHMIGKSSMLYEKVDDIFDEIEIEDEQEAVQLAVRKSDVIEIGPPDMSNAVNMENSGYNSPKRARLNVNYSFGPTGELEKQLQQQIRQQHQKHLQHQLQQQQQQKQTKPVKVQWQQSNEQQNVIVQSLSNVNNITLSSNSHAAQQQFQAVNSVSINNNRRKIQMGHRNS